MNRAIETIEDWGTLYYPTSALVIYETGGINADTYVEHFDMDKNGHPINAHPLTVREAQLLSKALDTHKETSRAFLKPNQILSGNILYINPSENGSVLWYTKAQERPLFFIKDLGIPNDKAYIPPLLWCADKYNLYLFALATHRRPRQNTCLYHAPFFNVNQNGSVCMGTVDITIKKSASLEEFVTAWENYFFNSYFSHLMHDHNPIKGNCVSLWKKLIKTGDAFPKEVLVKNNQTLKNLLR